MEPKIPRKSSKHCGAEIEKELFLNEIFNRFHEVLKLFSLDIMTCFFKEHPFTKELGMGVVDVHTQKLETVEEVKQRILGALDYLPAEQIMVDPDCGLKTRTWDEAKAKLSAMVQAVHQVKKERNLE